jgi:PAS domain S-box-containing protein
LEIAESEADQAHHDDDASMAERVWMYDWAATPLGPTRVWPQSLKTSVGIMLGVRTPASICWGPGLILLYNDAWRQLFDRKHPHALGRPAREVFPEAWDRVGPMIRRAMAGEATEAHDRYLPHEIYSRAGDAWLTYSFTPIPGEDGSIAGVLTLGIERTEQQRTYTALRESEARLREFGEASSDVLWVRDAETLRCEYLSPAFEDIYGVSRKEALGNQSLRNWVGMILPEDRGRVMRNLRRVRAGGRVAFEFRIRRRTDGAVRWLRNTDFPIFDDAGQVRRIGGIGQDVTAEKAREERLRDSEEGLRLALGVGRLATWDWNLMTGEIAWSDDHFKMLGYAVGEVTPSYETWVTRVHPEDRARVEASLRASAAERRGYQEEFRTAHPDGSVHWCAAQARYHYDEAGRPVRMIGVMQDITERHQWAERQRVLIAELQHRTRNLLGVVRAVADKTIAASGSLMEFRDHFRARLGALGRVNGMLSRLSEGDRITFDDLLRAELAAHDAAHEGGPARKVVLEGPIGVRLRSSMVQTFALALHELATNAVKYGALSQPQGRLTVRWRVVPGADGTRRLRVEWRESEVEVSPDRLQMRRGYGRELIERALPYQLKAETEYDLGPDGVRCSITLPISEWPEERGRGERGGG